MIWTKKISEDRQIVDSHQAENSTKLFLKDLDSTSPLSGWSGTIGGNSPPLLPSLEVVNQPKSYQGQGM